MSETHSSKICAICKNVKPSEAFYKNKIGHQESYVCKDCINKEIDNDIFKAIPWCDAFDIPVMIDCWNHLKRSRPDKPVFGRYLSICKLPIYRYFGFTDSLYIGTSPTKEEYKILQKEIIKYFIKKMHKGDVIEYDEEGNPKAGETDAEYLLHY